MLTSGVPSLGYRITMRILLMLILGAALAVPPAAAAITINIDLDAARAILALPGTTSSEAELEAIASLPGVEALIRQGARFNPQHTKENFVAGLRDFAAGRDPQPDPFRFTRVRERLTETRALVKRIEQDPDVLRRDVIARMRPYAPDSDFTTTLVLIAGGTSDGFSPGRGHLYVAVDYFRDDWDGLVLLAAHELYHVVQAVVLEESGVQARVNRMNGRPKEAAALLLTTLKEGTGSVVGDPRTVATPGSYNSWFTDKYKRNLDRLPQNFALFETLLFRLAHDDVPLARLYNLGFSGTWDSPLYFVGYRMAQVLEKYDGRESIQRAWSRPPAEFFRRYIALAREHPDDKDIIPLSDSTVKIVEQVAQAYAATKSAAGM